MTAALAGWLAQPQNVRGLAAPAPADVRERLDRLARRPASPFDPANFMFGGPGTALQWAAERGLVFGSEWGIDEMPREVALALREGFVAPFRSATRG